MKKSKKYMPEESFNLLVEALNQAIEYERGERDDLRVTVLAAPTQPRAKPAVVGLSTRDLIVSEIETLNEAELRQVADYVAFLRFQGRRQTTLVFDEARIAAIYAEFADEDLALAEEGIADYAVELEREDVR